MIVLVNALTFTLILVIIKKLYSGQWICADDLVFIVQDENITIITQLAKCTEFNAKIHEV